MGGKLSDEDKSTIEKAVDETISWLDSNKDASPDELKERKKDLESKVQPIVSKLYAGGAPPPAEGDDAEKGPSEDKDEL
jgi:heat shock protein 5